MKLVRRLIDRFEKARDEEGAALPLVASMLVVLIAMAAFATDLGWFYLNASRVQRAADAGALAGVIRMPDDFAQAETDARAATRANGYTHGTGAVDVDVQPVASDPNQIDVTVTDTIDTFFAKVVGLDSVTIRRTARGEFIPPLRLGSPNNSFGNQCDPEQPGCSGQPNFWANIHGKWTQRSFGDAYGPACSSGNNPTCATNPLHRPSGYLYGIDPNGQGSFTVSVKDLTFHNNSGSEPTNDGHRTGDRGCEDWGDGSVDCGPTMVITLYAPDPDPLDVSNNTQLCTHELPPQPQVPESDPYPNEALPGCFTVNGPSSGIYVVQVRHKDPGAVQNRSGLNRYSIASSSGTELFALGDMSIYNNFGGSTTEFYLAEVRDFYAGKTFVVELFDAGESVDPGTLQVVDPSGNVFDDGACRIYDRNVGGDWTLQSTPASCAETVTPSEYQDRWLKFEMDLPPTYSCGGSCWWKMNYVYTSGVNDTTTWRAYVVGNPIHLVPSGP